MALPVVSYASHCADLTKTVSPYLRQLRPLPQIIFESITDQAALKQIYLDTNPLIAAFAFSLFLAPIFLLVSEINRNYSQVDRAWSVLPTIYNAHYAIYAHLNGLTTRRLDALLFVSTIWSTRLTFNYSRKGGYAVGSEDYRWEVLRGYTSPWLFFLFNVLFISLAQSVLLFCITTPTYVILVAARASKGTAKIPEWDDMDLLAAGAGILIVLFTFIADQQQWNFQQAKKFYQKTAKVLPPFKQADLDRGFVASGLWAYSRHPNFAAEQAFWIAIYQWSCFTAGVMYNWTAIGPLLYIALFQASTWFTELIATKKYPEYVVYQRLVAKFIPKRGSGPMKWGEGGEKAEVETIEKKKDAANQRQRNNLR